MPDIKDEIIFADAGLDWDSDERFLKSGDSDYRLNVYNGQFGAEYVLTNLKGTTKYTHSFTHDTDYAGAAYSCIGDCYDNNRDAIYLFIHSSGGNHSILRFLFSDNSFEKIAFDHTGLGFDIEHPITDAFMIGDWLHWNPRTTSPRAINVQWAYYDHVAYLASATSARAKGDFVRLFNRIYEMQADVTNSYPPSAPEQFLFVDYCYADTLPVNATTLDGTVTSGEYFRYRDFYNIPEILVEEPNVIIDTDTNYQYNNIRGRRFQFCYRKYVKDQGYTISSPYTDIIAAPASETTYGEVVRDIDSFNLITIDIPLQGALSYGGIWYQHYMLFEFVEILFREGPDDDWKVAERINYDTLGDSITSTGNDSYTVSFYNDKSYEVADNASIEKQYNALPVTSKAQWSLDGIRSAYGGNVEGYDAVAHLDVSMSVGTSALTMSQGGVGGVQDTITFTSTYDEIIRRYTYESDDIELDTASAGDVIQVTVNGEFYSYVLEAADDDDDEAYANAVAKLLLKADIRFAVEASAVAGYVLSTIKLPPEFEISTVTRYDTVASITSTVKGGSFKNGAWHPFCLFYYDDAGRRSEPVYNEDMRLYVNTLPEEFSVGTESTNYQRTISWEIGHVPPSWATHWRWGYAGNQTIGKFWQYNIADAVYNEPRGQGSDTWTKIDITPLQHMADDTDTSLAHYFPNTVIDTYSWEPGDRLRFITKGVATHATYDTLLVADNNEDYEILEFDDVDNYVYIDALSGAVTNAHTIIVEIYRPLKQTGTTVYYEFGQKFETYTDDGVLYHKGELTDQDGTPTDATGKFVNGDVWVITRTFSLAAADDQLAFVESYGWSDFHETDGWGKGKTGVYTGIGQQYVNSARYSNKYEPTSQSSGVSTFDFLDYKPLSNDHGNITAMRQVGNTLKVYFERNSAAVMVNKTQFYSADGVSQILKSDNVLGDVAYSNYHYGTIFPESVCLKDRTVYFFDVYRDAFLQDSANGVEPISDNKMKRYFKEKAESILATGVGNVRVYSKYDHSLGALVVLFDIGEDTDVNNCILYHDKMNRWVTFLSWELDASGDGDIFTIATPQYLYTSPGMTMVSSFSYGLYSSSVVCTNTGSYSGDATFAGTNKIAISEGADITITAYVLSAADTSISDLLYMVITQPDGQVIEEALDNHIGSANTYTYTHEATQSGYLSVSFKMSGTGSVTKDDFATVVWSPSYTQITHPIPGSSVSELTSINGEDVWIHNTNATRNNFFGTQEESTVRVVGTKAPNVIKEFLTMGIHSNTRWDVDNIQIPATINYPDGMESLIPEAHFEEDEGVLRSEYLCNMKTTSGTASVKDLLNGDNLRGYIIKHDLTSDDTTEVYLFKVDVGSNASKM